MTCPACELKAPVKIPLKIIGEDGMEGIIFVSEDEFEKIKEKIEIREVFM